MLKIWRTCQAKRSKLSNADKCIEIRLASILQCQLYDGGRGRWMVRKGEDFSHKYSGILMASKFEILTFSFLKSTIKNSNSFADRQQTSTEKSRVESC